MLKKAFKSLKILVMKFVNENIFWVTVIAQSEEI